MVSNDLVAPALFRCFCFLKQTATGGDGSSKVREVCLAAVPEGYKILHKFPTFLEV